jgi:hypothetical protein
MTADKTLMTKTKHDNWLRGHTAKLFVYGIFLDEQARKAYKMTDPKYATVSDYVTIGNAIVQAVPVDSRFNCALTGLLVDIPIDQWDKLDLLEGGYDRIIIKTTGGHEAYMYVQGGSND